MALTYRCHDIEGEPPMFEGNIVNRNIKIVSISLLFMLSVIFITGGKLALMSDSRVIPAEEGSALILGADATASNVDFTLAFPSEWPVSEPVAVIAVDSPLADHRHHVCLLDTRLSTLIIPSSKEQSLSDSKKSGIFDYHLAKAIDHRITVENSHHLTPSTDKHIIPIRHCFPPAPKQAQACLNTSRL